jgi:Rft protein
MSTKDDDSGASMVLSGVRWIFIINVAQRLITFVLNQLMISFTSPEIFGLAAISFELLLSTLLFLSREGIRLACLREEIISPNQRQLVVNVSVDQYLARILQLIYDLTLQRCYVPIHRYPGFRALSSWQFCCCSACFN